MCHEESRNGLRGLESEVEGKRWNNKTSSWNVAHWEPASMALGLFSFSQARSMNWRKLFQVEREANHRQMNLIQREGSLLVQCDPFNTSRVSADRENVGEDINLKRVMR